MTVSLDWLSFTLLKKGESMKRLICSLFAISLAFSFNLNAEATKKETKAKKESEESKPKTQMVLLKTNKGKIKLKLNREKAPNTVDNFIAYVKKGHYKGTIFHRVIDGFMIQGGGFKKDLSKKSTNDPIENEANNGLRNTKYSIAMARTNDPHSASAQFFINVNDNDFLNFTDESQNGWGYAVFGEVTEGKDVVDKIKAVKTATQKGMQDVPVESVVIESAELL